MKSKKNTWTRKRHSFFSAIFRGLTRLYCRVVFHYKAKVNKLEKGKGYVIMSNHVTFCDQFAVGSYFNRHTYFIASDDLMNKWTGKYLMWLLAPIPKAKSSKDFSTIRNARKVINEGGIVGLFPEGNRNYDGNLCYIDIAIAKFCKVMKSDIILYNLVGGFGVAPRFGKTIRKGKMTGGIREIIPASEVESMTTEELYQRIIAGLTVEEPKTQYISDKKAEYAERSIYVCPDCNAVDKIYSEGNFIYCKECGLKVEYLENLDIATREGKSTHTTLAEWYGFQEKFAIEYFGPQNEVVLKDENIQLFQIENQHLSVLGNFDVNFSGKDGLSIFKGEELVLNVPFDDITNMGLVGKRKIIIYTVDTIYHLKENKVPINMMKYMNMFYVYKQKKEGEINNGNLFLGI